MRVLITAVCVASVVGLAAPSSQGIGIPAKMKSKKVQGDLVPAYYPASTGPGTGDDENDSPAILGTPLPRSDCTFDKGSFKVQTGKDATVTLKNVLCGGQPYNGSLCAHSKTLSTIMDEDIDKKGVRTPVTCISPAGSNTENTIQFVTGNIGLLTCKKGSCKGTLSPVANDPCPDVDKVNEVRRFEVFDGPDLGSLTVSGATIAACCGPGQTVAGPISVSIAPACAASTQHVLAEMGQAIQGVSK